jgi:NosR/NirI family transcriptional regulator, nitrous oxide reductase regulator
MGTARGDWGIGVRGFWPAIKGIAGPLLIALALSFAGPAQADSRLGEFLKAIQPGEIFPGADRIGPVDGKPPAAAAYAGDQLVGYVYLNADIVDSTGYSGKPINIVIAIALDGKIVGAKLVEHHEPIVLIGIPQEKVEHFIDGYVGKDFSGPPSSARSSPPMDIVSGATVSMMVIGDSITRSTVAIARSRKLGTAQPEAAQSAPAEIRTVDDTKSEVEDWQTLLGDGSVRRLHLSIADINQAFERTGNQAAIGRPEAGNPDDTFIDLYVAIVSVPSIGRSLLGDSLWNQLQKRLRPGQQAILVAGEGVYSFKGSGYVRGGIFDRIELLQGENSVRFRDRNHTRIGDIAAAGAPRFHEIGIFTVPDNATLDPTQPWRVQLLVQRATGAQEKAFLTFDLGYNLPDKYLKIVPQPASAPTSPSEAASVSTPSSAQPAAQTDIGESAAEPLWKQLWRAKILQIAVLLVALAILACVFFFQDWLVRRPVFYGRFRLGFLAFTLFWIGWYAQAQLSVVNVLTFTSALRTDFHWEYFLMDPLIFILWFVTAASILFWNRGAFCGWLCPFGALQELLNKGARVIGIPQLKVPFGLHQRLWVLKYVIFLVLFGLSLYELGMAERMSEIEPFKTAIVLRFIRDWPFVAFALALLVASLFVERFFCRYLCPLGAALAIPARLRMFDWLRRYRECGNPCQRCATECPVQAIHPEGNINPNECIQCLHCQMLYHHDQKCPVMIQKRLKREKRLATSSSSMRPGIKGGPALAPLSERPAEPRGR